VHPAPDEAICSLKVDPLNYSRTVRRALVSTVCAVLIVAVSTSQRSPAQTPAAAAPPSAQPAPAQPAAQAPPKPANVNPTAILILVRSVLIALDQANKTGNYSVLRDIGSPDFQRNNSAARLAEIFANQRNGNFDLSNVAVLDPQMTLQPQIDPNGMLHFAGFYPAPSGQMNFEFLLQPVNNKWVVFGLAVNFAQAGAASENGKPPEAAKSAEAKPGQAKFPAAVPPVATASPGMKR
jgi:hypothetical protein